MRFASAIGSSPTSGRVGRSYVDCSARPLDFATASGRGRLRGESYSGSAVPPSANNGRSGRAQSHFRACPKFKSGGRVNEFRHASFRSELSNSWKPGPKLVPCPGVDFNPKSTCGQFDDLQSFDRRTDQHSGWRAVVTATNRAYITSRTVFPRAATFAPVNSSAQRHGHAATEPALNRGTEKESHILLKEVP